MFVAREHELQVLEKLFTSDSFEMVVLYGRRRVGKITPDFLRTFGFRV